RGHAQFHQAAARGVSGFHRARGREGVTAMADQQLDVLVICGSLRRGSYNAALARSLPALAPPGMALRSAPSFAGLPVYNYDEHQATGIPPIATAWIDAIRAA